MFKKIQLTRATFQIISIFGILMIFLSTVFASTLSHTTNITDTSPTSNSPNSPVNVGLYEKVTCFTVTVAGNVIFDASGTGSVFWHSEWVLSSDDDVLEASDNTILNLPNGVSGSTTESLAVGDYTLFITLPNVNVNSGNPTYSTDITGDVEACESAAPVSSDPQPAFIDGRINNFDTAAPIAVYPHNVGDEVGLIIYNADGVELLIVSPQQIADVPSSPDGNVLVAEGGGITLHRLAGGYWQLDTLQYNGKIYVMIFPELFSSGGYESFELDG